MLYSIFKRKCIQTWSLHFLADSQILFLRRMLGVPCVVLCDKVRRRCVQHGIFPYFIFFLCLVTGAQCSHAPSEGWGGVGPPAGSNLITDFDLHIYNDSGKMRLVISSPPPPLPTHFLNSVCFVYLKSYLLVFLNIFHCFISVFFGFDSFLKLFCRYMGFFTSEKKPLRTFLQPG
jgi:hypothetical protein